MPTKLLFSFDSEDYITPEAADAEKWWAEAMTRHGITANICVVSELARQLQATGREDVLDAWKPHEIASHTDCHSRPPTPAEYLEPCGWEDGIAEAMRREGKGIGDLEALTGRHPIGFCKPGSSWGPQVCPAMARMAVPVFCDGPFVWDAEDQPLWYAGQLMLSYHIHFDGYMDREEDRLERMKADFERSLARHDGRYLVMYTHPCRLVTSEFWDGVNFREGAHPARSDWRPAPLRPPDRIASMQRDFDAFLGWVAAHPEVELTTYSQLLAELKEPPARGVSPETVIALLRRTADVPDAVIEGKTAYSPAELLGMGAALFSEEKPRHRSVPLRRLLGPADSPPATDESIREETLSMPAAKAALREADRFMSETGRIPSQVTIGGRTIGPGTLFRLLRGLALSDRERMERIALEPGPELPAFADSHSVKRLHFQGGWVVYPPEFVGGNVIHHARLQTWTAKPAW